MTSLVSELFINPVLRQARRLSRSSYRSKPQATSSPHQIHEFRPSFEDAIDEPEGDVHVQVSTEYLKDTLTTGLVPQVEERETMATENQEIGVAAAENRDDLTVLTPVASRAGQDALGVETVSDDAEDLATEEPSQEHRRTLSLPADDGFGELRKKIRGIQSREIPMGEKARMMHELLMEGYTQSQIVFHLKPRSTMPAAIPASSSTAPPEHPSPTQGAFDSALKSWHNLIGDASALPKITVSDEDMRPTYVPPHALAWSDDTSPEDPQEAEGHREQILGCEHYRRNVKLQCSTCDRWHTCRLCHDAVEDHILIRNQTKNMLCMICGIAQRAGDVCAHCGETAAHYYCNVCKLWDDDPNKNIYHCNDCGICRKGRGIGRDFFHCKTCNACLSISMEKSHRCIERLVECDCPICGDYMFNSTKPVVFMACGHSIHATCYEEHKESSYRCPICSKSLYNMDALFRNLELSIQSQPMPPEFQDTMAVISCNDCLGKSQVKYHWLGLKCAICHSYNTIELQILKAPTFNRGVANTVSDLPAGQPPPAISSAALLNEHLDRTALPVPVPAAGVTAAVGVTAPRDVPPRRRHSSNVSALGHYQPPERLARSVSPPTLSGHAENAAESDQLAGNGETDNESEEEDMFDFWGRDELRSATSVENVEPGNCGKGEEDEEDDEEDEESDSGGEDNEAEEDEDDIMLFGHR